jgi:hypothetical protein
MVRNDVRRQAVTVTRDEAEQTLSPFFDNIWKCIVSAVEEYENIPAAQRVKFKPRTRANIINDFMVHNARELLAGLPNVRIEDEKRQFRVIISDRFRMRLKKFDKNLKTSNVPTQQALAFINQIQLEIGAPPNLTNIVAGYRWNILQTELHGVFIVCPFGRRNEWTLEISAPPLPAVSHIPLAVDQPPPVVPKETPAEELPVEKNSG